MKISIIRGAEAALRLADTAFLSSWNALYGACEWATGFQTPAFVRTWYAVYESRHEAVVALATSEDGVLKGFWALAANRKTGDLLPCGWPNAEYYNWIARREHSDAFITAALAELWKHFPAGRLVLNFLPPGTPVDWVCSRHKSVVRPTSRPVRDLLQDSSAASLKKKSNRSRINRLERIGRVNFRELASRTELEQYIDTIAEYCDLRQGALNGSLPFREDSLKRELFLRLFEHPQLVHACVLTVAGELAATHIGVLSRSELALGLIAHSPFLAEHSPGKLLLLFLASRLAEEGVARFDLTPGGDYKERFHNTHDEAYTLWAFARRSHCARFVWGRRARTAVKRLLAAASIDTEALKRRLRTRVLKRSRARLVIALAQLAKHQISSAEEICYYVVETGRKGSQPVSAHEFAVNRVSDLVLYRPSSPRDCDVQQFLRDALDRLTAGDRVYTVASGDTLLHSAWMGRRTGKESNGAHEGFDFPANSVVLWDDFTHVAARGRELTNHSILVRVNDAVAEGANQVYATVNANDRTARRSIEDAGFTYHGSMIRRMRFGKTEVQWYAAK